MYFTGKFNHIVQPSLAGLLDQVIESGGSFSLRFQGRHTGTISASLTLSLPPKIIDVALTKLAKAGWQHCERWSNIWTADGFLNVELERPFAFDDKEAPALS